MLVNYRWIWCRLSLQISDLMFTCKHLQFEWHIVYCISRKEFRESLHFRPTSMHRLNFMGHLLPCAVDFKPNWHPYICNTFGKSTNPRHVISIGPRLPEVPSQAGVCCGNSPILNHHSNSSQYIVSKYSCFKLYICILSQGLLSISSHSLGYGRVLLEYKMYQIRKKYPYQSI